MYDCVAQIVSHLTRMLRRVKVQLQWVSKQNLSSSEQKVGFYSLTVSVVSIVFDYIIKNSTFFTA